MLLSEVLILKEERKIFCQTEFVNRATYLIIKKCRDYIDYKFDLFLMNDVSQRETRNDY